MLADESSSVVFPGLMEKNRCESIALYLPNLASGGAETVFLRLCREMLSRGRRVAFVLDRAEGPLLAQARAMGVPVHALGAKRTLAAIRPLACWIDAERPDVVMSAISHNNLAAILAARLARTRCRVVVGEHAALHSHSLAMGTWRHRLMPLLARLVYPLADAVVGVAQGVSDELVEQIGLPRALVTTIWNPVVTDDFPARAALPAPHPWLSDGGPPVIMAAGRLAPVKDYPTLLTAIARLRQSRPVRALVLGDGPEREALSALRDTLGLADCVELPGRCADPLPWFARAAALAVSSRSEGFALTLVEAMALGIPVASTDCPVGPRDILDGGQYGPLTPVGDAQALADALAGLLDAPPPPEHLRARAAAFTVARSTDAFLALFDRLCGPPCEPS